MFDKISSFTEADNIINKIIYTGICNMEIQFSKSIYKTYFINNILKNNNTKYINCLSTEDCILNQLYKILNECADDDIIIFDNFIQQPHLIKIFKTFKYIFI